MVGPPHSAHQLSAPDPRVDLTSGGSERKSVTETDLITAGGSDENVELPQTQPVNSDNSSSQGRRRRRRLQTARPPRKPRPRPTSRRAIAPRRCRPWCCPNCVRWPSEIGVEGASGMRKSELVAAIRERRGESNGRPQAGTASSDSTDTANACSRHRDRGRRDRAGRRGAGPAAPRASRCLPRGRRTAERRRSARTSQDVRPAEQGRHRKVSRPGSRTPSPTTSKAIRAARTAAQRRRRRRRGPRRSPRPPVP